MLLVVLIVILCAVFALRWSVKLSRGSPPVYPGALPVIGHAHQLLGDALQLWLTEKELYHFCLDNGGVIELRFGPYPVYVITNIEDCQTVANTCFEKPNFYKFAKELYGSGLATADATTWKPHRKLLNSAFNQQILNTFVQEHTAQAKRLVSELAAEAGKGSFDVVPYLFKAALRSVYKTTIGGKPNDHDQEVTLKNYAIYTKQYSASVGTRTRNIWLHIPFIFNMSSLKKEQDLQIKNIKNMTETVVSVLKCCELLEAGKKQETFTNEEIREHMDTFIAAAHDTQAKALTLCLLLVGSHPDVHTRIFKELQEVLDDPDKDLTKYDLPKLVYLEAVLKETLRLYPIVPRIARRSDSAVKLMHYTFPARSFFLISLYGMNRHPVWGPDANEFKPERWLDPATLPDNPNAFTTFSIGKRNCIGKQYAMMSMKTTLAYILRRYHVTGDINNVQYKCNIILNPVIGHHVSLKLRE